MTALDSSVEGPKETGPIALIFDTETTGMVRFRDPYTDPSQPDLVQLGFLMVDTSDWKIRNQGSFLVQLRNDAGLRIEQGAQKVHGISEQDCADFGIQHETALDLFENLCSSADVLVGHNIRFDAIVMQTAFYRDRRRSDDSPFLDDISSKNKICTMMESIDLCKLPSKSNSASYKWPSLEEAHKFVTGGDKGEEGEAMEGAHDALVDSEACLKVFRYLMEHGHVSIEKTRTTVTETKSITPSASVQESKRTIESPNDSSTAAILPKEPSISESFEDIEIANDEIHNHDIQDRNGGTDRSREIEDMGVSSCNDTVNEVGGSAKVFDPASFSSDILGEASASGEGFRVRGNTYAHKEMIKQLGGRWHSEGKEWIFRESRHLSKLESYEDLTIVPFLEEEVSRK